MSEDFYDHVTQDAPPSAEEGRVPASLRDEVYDLQWLMKRKQGRRIVWRLLNRTRFFESSQANDRATVFLDGQRTVGVQLHGLFVEFMLDDYALMLREHKDYVRDSSGDR